VTCIACRKGKCNMFETETDYISMYILRWIYRCACCSMQYQNTLTSAHPSPIKKKMKKMMPTPSSQRRKWFRTRNAVAYSLSTRAVDINYFCPSPTLQYNIPDDYAVNTPKGSLRMYVSSSRLRFLSWEKVNQIFVHSNCPPLTSK
jgi:hypothetical protein